MQAVNSFHHQTLKDIRPDLNVSAKTPDGTVATVEGTDENFVLAVQWPPEMMTAKGDLIMLKLFQRLVQESNKYKNSRALLLCKGSLW